MLDLGLGDFVKVLFESTNQLLEFNIINNTQIHKVHKMYEEI